MQIPSKASSISDPIPVAVVTPTTPLTASTPIIPSPSSVSIPSVVQHEPSTVPNAPQMHAHQTIPNSHHHHVNEQSQTAAAAAATIAAHHHIDQTMLTHPHQLTSTTAAVGKSLVNQPNHHEYNSMDQYEPQMYSNHYNATDINHPTMNSSHQHHQPGSEFIDANYYMNYYSYDDQMRPYSASSNSCSSSNSDGDSSQLTAHGMHQHYSNSNSNNNNNNNNIHLHHHNHHNHSSHHQIGQTGGILSANTTSTGEPNDIRSNGGDPNISPNEYSDCMNREPQHIFELNCFAAIGHGENVTNTHQLHDVVHGNYMHEYTKNHFGDIHHMSAHVATNSSGGIAQTAIIGNAELSANNGTNVDAIQYTSVIVEPTNFHMTNKYDH